MVTQLKSHNSPPPRRSSRQLVTYRNWIELGSHRHQQRSQSLQSTHAHAAANAVHLFHSYLPGVGPDNRIFLEPAPITASSFRGGHFEQCGSRIRSLSVLPFPLLSYYRVGHIRQHGVHVYTILRIYYAHFGHDCGNSVGHKRFYWRNLQHDGHLFGTVWLFHYYWDFQNL